MNNLKTTKIKRINRLEPNTVYDIEVEGAHHYLLEDGTLSHNSVGSYIPMNVQSGGCMIPGTLIRTSNGLSKIEDIKEGDTIPTLYGERKVLKTWTFEKPTYTVAFSNGVDYTVSDNHRFLHTKDFQHDENWTYVKDLSVGSPVLVTSETGELSFVEVLSVVESGVQKVHDLTVEEVEHYITKEGIVCHNTGLVYATSVILEFGKAGLKETAEDQAEGMNKSGIVVTSKMTKGRFARPIPIKFHISFYKGMNPYVGLENYVSWDVCGIGRGKLIEEIIEHPIYEEDGVTQKILRGKPAVRKENTGNWIYLEDQKANTFAVKHLGKVVKGANLFTKEVFTDEIIDILDEKVIKKTFELPDVGDFDEDEELDEVLNEDGDDFLDE